MKHEWQDRPGNARPTKERQAKGRFHLGETREAGIRFAFDETSDPLSRLYATHQIEPWEWEAAEAFEELARLVLGDVGQRSCLNFDPVGHDEGEGDEIAEGAWKTLRLRIVTEAGFPCLQAVQAAAYFREDVDNIRLLKAGLAVCGDYFRISR